MSTTPPRPPSQNGGDDTTTQKDITAQKEPTYSDPSGAIFSMYITRALKFDDENVENWKGGADGILVFVRFRAALTMMTYSQEPSLFLDWPFLFYDRNFHCHQLSELAARHHPVPPHTNIPTTCKR